jgi:hypothetical protein
LGYRSTTQGWSTGPANVPTPFGVIPPVSPITVAGALATGTQQGIALGERRERWDRRDPVASNVLLSGLSCALMGSGGMSGGIQLAAHGADDGVVLAGQLYPDPADREHHYR